MNYHIQLIPDHTYHIFSRAIGKEKLFIEEDNYQFFLRQFLIHILPVGNTFAYTLLPNHFHFMIRIKDIDTIHTEFLRVKKNKKFTIELAPEFVMERFSNLLNSYTKAFNKKNSRKGGLFINLMRRVEIIDDSQFGATIFYIHKNPVHHQYAGSIGEWVWSSYNSLISKSPTMLLRDEVIEWFGGREQFEIFHQQPIYLKDDFIEE